MLCRRLSGQVRCVVRNHRRHQAYAELGRAALHRDQLVTHDELHVAQVGLVVTQRSSIVNTYLRGQGGGVALHHRQRQAYA